MINGHVFISLVSYYLGLEYITTNATCSSGRCFEYATTIPMKVELILHNVMAATSPPPFVVSIDTTSDTMSGIEYSSRVQKAWRFHASEVCSG